MAAIRFVQKIAKLAEAADHHPDLHLTGYRELKISLSTHDIGRLSKKDYSLASQIERLPKSLYIKKL